MCGIGRMGCMNGEHKRKTPMRAKEATVRRRELTTPDGELIFKRFEEVKIDV